jgi:hypothetical protein
MKSWSAWVAERNARLAEAKVRTPDHVLGYCMSCSKPLWPLRQYRNSRTCSHACRQRLYRRRHGLRTYPGADMIRHQLSPSSEKL